MKSGKRYSTMIKSSHELKMHLRILTMELFKTTTIEGKSETKNEKLDNGRFKRNFLKH